MLLQKTYRENHITKKKCVNEGEYRKFYMKDAHEPIIDRNTFQMVQVEMKRRANKASRQKPAGAPSEFTGKIICDQCGKHYQRKVLPKGKVVWMCATFNRLGKEHCPSQRIPDDILRETIGTTDFIEIHIPCANTIKIISSDGTETVRTWRNHSRSESWTEEMKQAARERGQKNA